MNDIFVTVPTENAEEPRECKLQIVTFSDATCFSAGKFPGGERGTSHMKSLWMLVRKFELTPVGDHSGHASSFINFVEAAWPSGQHVRLVIQQSRVQVPL